LLVSIATTRRTRSAGGASQQTHTKYAAGHSDGPSPAGGVSHISTGSPMRVLRTIVTPWAPYSVTLSRDGTRLAVGGGTWYGSGGILIADISSGVTELFPCDRLPGSPGSRAGAPTVSGVCFSADDRHLAASTWTSGQHLGPTVVFEVDGLHLTHRETFHSRHEGDLRDPTPTGVLLAGNYLVTHNHRAAVAHVVAVRALPRRLGVDRGPAPHHLTSARLVTARGCVISGCDGLTPRQDLEAGAGGRDLGRAADGLVVVPLKGDGRDVEVVPVHDLHRVTAIGAGPSGEEFVTGGLDGELDLWSWVGGWMQHRLRPATARGVANHPDLDLTWATYTPSSVVGVCSLASGERWASVSAGGEVCLWDRTSLTRSWELPEPGSPRSLAAHPDRLWVAVGVKKGGFARPQSAVVLAEVMPTRLDPAWRTPTAQALARAVDEQRPSPEGPLDPLTLAVLADALEESGCTDTEVLAHLRNHGRRLRGCWVIDQLLGKEAHQ
jgi:hypothetical protein